MPCDWQWRIRVLCLSIFHEMSVIIISYKMHFAEQRHVIITIVSNRKWKPLLILRMTEAVEPHFEVYSRGIMR